MKFLFYFLFMIFSLNVFSQETQIILTRHAEKMAGSNPGLTSAGQKRAEALIHLEDAFSLTIRGIYTSHYRRTIETATPTADYLNLEIKNDISPVDYEAYQNDILSKHRGKAVLLVGHSNTVPEFINFLRPDLDLPWIDEADFSNLFIVRIKDDGKILVEKYRYEASEEGLSLKRL